MRAVFDDDADPGTYFGPARRNHLVGYPVAHRSNPLSYDETIAARLWTLSEEMTGVSYGL